ncbi:MAG: hypothetical protein IPK33_10900 [Gemmatimonadetes bacterium]|nr:hypothetical protein [Gemmatimonadota bacterium]
MSATPTAERLEFVNCITTNKTAFFREQHHFDFLRHEVIGADPSRALRIWSAACSTGEEPYSIAMTVREARASASILASDIDTQVLTTARAGLYTAERVASIDEAALRAHFRRGEGSNAGFLGHSENLNWLGDLLRAGREDDLSPAWRALRRRLRRRACATWPAAARRPHARGRAHRGRWAARVEDRGRGSHGAPDRAWRRASTTRYSRSGE